jgi:hypothetical protein
MLPARGLVARLLVPFEMSAVLSSDRDSKKPGSLRWIKDPFGRRSFVTVRSTS